MSGKRSRAACSPRCPTGRRSGTRSSVLSWATVGPGRQAAVWLALHMRLVAVLAAVAGLVRVPGLGVDRGDHPVRGPPSARSVSGPPVPSELSAGQRPGGRPGELMGRQIRAAVPAPGRGARRCRRTRSRRRCHRFWCGRCRSCRSPLQGRTRSGPPRPRRSSDVAPAARSVGVPNLSTNCHRHGPAGAGAAGLDPRRSRCTRSSTSLVGALCSGLHVVAGFTNRSLRARA